MRSAALPSEVCGFLGLGRFLSSCYRKLSLSGLGHAPGAGADGCNFRVARDPGEIAMDGPGTIGARSSRRDLKLDVDGPL